MLVCEVFEDLLVFEDLVVSEVFEDLLVLLSVSLAFLDVAFDDVEVVLDLLVLSFLTLACLPEVEVGMEQQFS
ncbi:MAG: hypothetical protein RI513_00205 [Balneolaceae bacterium]|nr:hypothetical protein [Balneolaceae bacterium]MDR9446535.1 hypothetical protein [Balneolaceae bacterium]